ncbi:MAG: AAA-like domain-containing protein, partial [bacterium]
MEARDHNVFFKTGGTLPSDAPSYIARDADQRLFEVLKSGEYCYLLNSRQMGKSSLCVRAVQELQKLGVRTVYLELSEIGGANVDAPAWYATLLNRIGRELGIHRELAAYRRERNDLSPISSLFFALEEVALNRISEPIVIILDEIDTVRSLTFPADEFFGALRGIYNRRVSEPSLSRLTFCLVGSSTPAELISDTRLSPFNIGERVDIRDFTRSEASPLAQGLMGDNCDGNSLLDRIY